MKKFLGIAIILGTLLTAATANAQRLSRKNMRKFDLAYALAEESNNRKAIDLLQEIYKTNPDNIDVVYNLGLCYMNMSGNPDSALFFLEKTLKLDTDPWSDATSELKMAIARVKQMKYDYDGALKIYKQVERHDKEKIWAEAIEHERSICENAKVLITNPVRLEIEKLSDNVNSEFNDYRPVISADQNTIFFTSRRKNKVKEIFDDGENEEQTYVSNRQEDGTWSEATRIDGLFSSKGQVTATCVHDNELYIVRDGDIYISRRDSANGNWNKATTLGPTINSSSDERYAFVSADGSELYFSSNREGGFGGFDIYHSYRLPNGQWGIPRNLGSVINTEYDEDSPVMHAEKPVLYFSSNGHNSMGGYDIFFSIKNENDSAFQAVQNIGYPINTPDDDLYFVPTTEKDMAYYASINWDKKGQDFTGYDIYEVTYDEPEINTLAILSGHIKSLDVSGITVTALQDGEPIGRYTPNAETGKFVIIVEEDSEYTIEIQSDVKTEKIVVSTHTGDSYFKLGHTIELDKIDFTEAEMAAAQAAKEKEKRSNGRPEYVEGKTYYTVQILTLYDTLKVDLDLDEDMIYHHKTPEWHVYSYGVFDNLEDAREAQKLVGEKTPISDAFIRKLKSYDIFVNRAIK
ncbi:MAG: tetratricopeptide repeat protein [Bacteroidales bacterium]|nr:tetratricopeptide repeat protein [Bacteroidales bacterium]